MLELIAGVCVDCEHDSRSHDDQIVCWVVWRTEPRLLHAVFQTTLPGRITDAVRRVGSVLWFHYARSHKREAAWHPQFRRQDDNILVKRLHPTGRISQEEWTNVIPRKEKADARSGVVFCDGRHAGSWPWQGQASIKESERRSRKKEDERSSWNDLNHGLHRDTRDEIVSPSTSHRVRKRYVCRLNSREQTPMKQGSLVYSVK